MKFYYLDYQQDFKVFSTNRVFKYCSLHCIRCIRSKILIILDDYNLIKKINESIQIQNDLS